MNVNIIYARDANGVIGNNGTIPWHIPEDLEYFKRTTGDEPVIMGSKTWTSLPDRFKPLPGRPNVVVTTNTTLANEVRYKGAIAFCDEPSVDIKEVLLAFKRATNYDNVWVVGGTALFEQVLPYVHYAYVTEIQEQYTGDTFAPALVPEQWAQIHKRTIASKSLTKVSFCVYQNRNRKEID